jgi:hypothetical protein
MGLKGYRLWAMGQLDSNVQRPTGLVAWKYSSNRSLVGGQMSSEM